MSFCGRCCWSLGGTWPWPWFLLVGSRPFLVEFICIEMSVAESIELYLIDTFGFHASSGRTMKPSRPHRTKMKTSDSAWGRNNFLGRKGSLLLTWITGVSFKGILVHFIPIDSSWNALQLVFWLWFDLVNTLAAFNWFKDVSSWNWGTEKWWVFFNSEEVSCFCRNFHYFYTNR